MEDPSKQIVPKKRERVPGSTQKPFMMRVWQPCMQIKPAPEDAQSESCVQRGAQDIPLLSPTHKAPFGHELLVPAA